MRQEIEIKGLPKGYEVSEVTLHDNFMEIGSEGYVSAVIKLEKIKPRRIVLEETEEVADTTQFMNTGDVQLHIQGNKIWKEVEEGE